MGPCNDGYFYGRKVQEKHEAAGCADGSNCHGPGCRLYTGKTANKRETERLSAFLANIEAAKAAADYEARKAFHQ